MELLKEVFTGGTWQNGALSFTTIVGLGLLLVTLNLKMGYFKKWSQKMDKQIDGQDGRIDSIEVEQAKTTIHVQNHDRRITTIENKLNE